MKWLLIGGGVAIFGIAAFATYSAFHSPDFWLGLVVAMASAILPFVEKRMDPKKEAAWRHEEAAGRGDEYLRKRYGGLKE